MTVSRIRRALLAASAAAVALPVLAQPAAAPAELRIGFQKGAAILVLARKQQLIEQRLKDLGVGSVKWVEFSFGPPMLEAMGAGAVDLGSVGDTPPIFAQAGGSPLVYVAATPSSQHAVLVPPGSAIRTLADLKGKRVAFGKGSSAHNVAVKALALAGLTLKDVEPLYLSPADATAAFNGGKLDAWVVWDPYVAIAERHYGARAIADTSDKRLASASYYLASRDFATRYPQVLQAVLDEIGKLTQRSTQRRDELAAVAAEATGIDRATWQTVFARAEVSFGPVTPANVQQQQELADSFFAQGVIPRRIKVADAVWTPPAP
ncbi:aliphatic sulfonate ABC transporter substrate-binding protein [Rubrivivax gelatinosus]|uniref:aliphatic sulfonate ABC transporter substrate-binding protein n=1 Tax=Rubrivivax gelatinosus TaxID=28068 RepID=UPI0002DC89EC|nr:aliphatic sulfonate ABC transporter substrate-binding protein [Rubrivivax gelatinosus]MBG6082406.1 sulfonate transport system substrate-binding protein [Rubrivivax gelatinosus]